MASKWRRPSRTATTLRKVSEMLLGAERAAVADACRALRRDRLVIGTAGNVSLRVGDLVAVSPSGVDYDAVTPELVGVHRLDGSPLRRRWPRPASCRCTWPSMALCPPRPWCTLTGPRPRRCR